MLLRSKSATVSSVSEAEATEELDRLGPIGIVRSSGATLVGLTAIGIAQPLLDLYSRNGAVLASLDLNSSELALWLVVISLGPAACLLAIELAAGAIGAGAQRVAHLVTTAGGVLTIALVTLRQIGIDDTIAVGLMGVAAAILGAAAIHRFAPVRLLTRYLAVSIFAFIGLFLAGDGGELFAGGTAGPVVPLADREYPPIVFVIFDEFPLTLIVDEDGMINQERFPAFSELASEATWFRNASSVSQFTTWAVPAILTGRFPGDDQLPTSAEHPNSIYTLLASHYSITSYSVAVDICPNEICGGSGAPGGPVVAMQDAAVVWGHRSLPPALSDRLPRTDQRLGGFVGGRDTSIDGDGGRHEEGEGHEDGDDGRGQVWDSIPLDEREPGGQAAVFSSLVRGLSGGASLTMAHVAIPHWPWQVTPFGYEISTTHDHELYYADEGLPGRDFAINQMFQRHVLQAGAVDQLVGELVDTMKARGIWDDALVIITSDHGNSHLGPTFGRMVEAGEGTVDELLRIPLFIKVPGQTVGSTRDENARTIDLLPTIVDVLGIDDDLADVEGWQFDGHSLIDGSPFPERNIVTQGSVDEMSTAVEPLFDLARRHAEPYTGDDSWDGLAAVGPLGPLVGQPLDAIEISPASQHRWRLDQRSELADLDLDSGRLPLVVSGMVWPEGDDPLPDHGLVTMSGTVVGVAGGFLEIEPGGYLFSSLLIDRFVEGLNEVDLLLPTGTTLGGRPVMAPVAAQDNAGG